MVSWQGRDLEALGALLEHEWVVLYSSLEPTWRALGHLVVALVLTGVVVGLAPGYSIRPATRARRSPILSSAVGVPAVLTMFGLLVFGYLILETLAFIFGVVFLLIGAVVLPTAVVVGLVAVGQSVAMKLNRDGLFYAVLVGCTLWGIAGLSVPATLSVAAITATLGLGALVRIRFGVLDADDPTDRTVPPSNKT